MVTDLLEWRKLKRGLQERGFPPSPLFLQKSCVLSRFSRVWLFATPWTIACQAPLSRGFSRQEYWSGYSLIPSLEDLSHPGIEPESLISPTLAGVTTSAIWKACRKAAAAKSLQSCLTLCDPIDGSPLGSPSLGFSRQEHWSGLPFPSPMHESEKWKWSRSVVSDPQRPHGLQPSRLLHPWDFPGKSTGVGCHCLLRAEKLLSQKKKKERKRASLVVQWLRVSFAMQGTSVWSLVQEDPTCLGATNPVSHNF